jgi:hypothetical protein
MTHAWPTHPASTPGGWGRGSVGCVCVCVCVYGGGLADGKRAAASRGVCVYGCHPHRSTPPPLQHTRRFVSFTSIDATPLFPSYQTLADADIRAFYAPSRPAWDGRYSLVGAIDPKTARACGLLREGQVCVCVCVCVCVSACVRVCVCADNSTATIQGTSSSARQPLHHTPPPPSPPPPTHRTSRWPSAARCWSARTCRPC